MSLNQTKKSTVEHLVVSADQAGRRIDNYLTGILKDIPRTRIYRMLRTGEVRVNSARVKQDYRVMEQDVVRVPPVFRNISKKPQKRPSPAQSNRVAQSIIYEDDYLLVLNKPAGIAVHAGSGEDFGIIEILRALRPQDEYLELVHRLDKQTSGCLLIARNHRVLRELHNMLRDTRYIKKEYLALLKGNLHSTRKIEIPLGKNQLRSGERMVQPDIQGKIAKTEFHPIKNYKNTCLVRVDITTGRTHQIRVHAASIGHPVAGDDKYGDRDFNKQIKKAGLKRMFLHAEKLTLKLPYSGKTRTFKSDLSGDMEKILTRH